MDSHLTIDMIAAFLFFLLVAHVIYRFAAGPRKYDLVHYDPATKWLTVRSSYFFGSITRQYYGANLHWNKPNGKRCSTSTEYELYMAYSTWEIGQSIEVKEAEA